MNIKNKKAFTIIELIVVIAVLGILVLFAMPRIIGYSAKAQLVRIQHDTKVMQDKMEEVLSNNNKVLNEWNNNEKDLGVLIMRKQLYETRGLVKVIDKTHIEFPKYNWDNVIGQYTEGYGIGGHLMPLINEDMDGFGYKIIPEEYKNEIKTRLNGTFYSNAQGKVYYEPNKPLTGIKSEFIAPNCASAEAFEYTFDHKTGTIEKYLGTSQYIIIPEAFLVDGKCWPVLIIGKGAFARNIPPIKGVILPPGLIEVKEDAFIDNEIEEIVIPPGVTDIGDGAFADNNFITDSEGSDGVIIQRYEGSVNIGNKAFDSANPVYKLPTNKDIGVIVEPNKDLNGNLIIGLGGRPTGSISSGGWGGNGGGSSGNNSNSVGKVVIIPDVIIVDGTEVEITKIGQGAFQGEGIIHVTLPSGLERIDDYAFAGNQLIGVNIPQKVKYIGNYAFAYNELYNGKDYKWTIDYIDFKAEEQLDKVNKNVGNIEEGGSKIDILKDSNLLDHIWITNAYNFIIPEDYNPIIKDYKREVPSTPQINNITDNSVIVNGGEGTEVKIDDGNWYDSPHEFTNLSEGSNYMVYSRYKETKTHYASEASAGTDFNTIIIPKGPIIFSYSSKVQEYTIPATGTYRLEVDGARGGNGGSNRSQGKFGEFGSKVTGDFILDRGDVIYITTGSLGSQGRNCTLSCVSGTTSGQGGGASYVNINTMEDFIISGKGGNGGLGAGQHINSVRPGFGTNINTGINTKTIISDQYSGRAILTFIN